jgi:hypothetical protein
MPKHLKHHAFVVNILLLISCEFLLAFGCIKIVQRTYVFSIGGKKTMLFRSTFRRCW